MKFEESPVPGVFLIEPELLGDARGFFARSFCQREFAQHGLEQNYVQCNLSYNADKGTNYAQARYLCYYLQEQGLLRKFYHSFRANCTTDPTGFDTLQKTLARQDMGKFKQDWEAYVLKLRFP